LLKINFCSKSQLGNTLKSPKKNFVDAVTSFSLDMPSCKEGRTDAKRSSSFALSFVPHLNSLHLQIPPSFLPTLPFPPSIPLLLFQQPHLILSPSILSTLEILEAVEKL